MLKAPLPSVALEDSDALQLCEGMMVSLGSGEEAVQSKAMLPDLTAAHALRLDRGLVLAAKWCLLSNCSLHP